MKQLINTKELCKQIRYFGKHGMIIWSREESQHFITNGHFLVRFEEMPKEVLAALFGVYYKLPEVGETLNAQFGEIADNTKPIDYKNVYQPDKQVIEGEVTAFIRDFGDIHFCRVIKFPNRYSLVNENYLKLSAADDMPKTKDDSPHVPIYLAEGNLVLLPYRVTDEKKEVLDDLLGADNQ